MPALTRKTRPMQWKVAFGRCVVRTAKAAGVAKRRQACSQALTSDSSYAKLTKGFRGDMPRWLPRMLAGVHERASTGKVRLTAKAHREVAALGAGLDPEDVREVLLGLTASDSAGRHVSRKTSEWMYVFRLQLGGECVYLKLVLRGECVVVSFHENEGGGHGEDE